jgi:hypothetical protein
VIAPGCPARPDRGPRFSPDRRRPRGAPGHVR